MTVPLVVLVLRLPAVAAPRVTLASDSSAEGPLDERRRWGRTGLVSDGAVDIWVNLTTTESAAQFLGQEQYANVAGYLGGDGEQGVGVDDLLGRMDRAGVETGVLT